MVQEATSDISGYCSKILYHNQRW